MTLVPVDGVLAVVSKVAHGDPETANLFTQLTLFESMKDLYDDAWDEIEPDVLDYMTSRVAKARATLLRGSVAKALDSQEAPVDHDLVSGLAVLDRYTEVSKDGLVGSLLAAFNQKHPRDSQGRFIRSNTGRTTTPEQPVGNRNQGYVQEVRSTVGGWKNAGVVTDETGVRLHFRRVDNNGRLLAGSGTETLLASSVGAAGDDASAALADYQASGEPRVLVGVSVDRKDLNRMKGPQRRAAMDLLAATAGDNADIPSMARATEPLDRQQDWSGAGQAWNRPTQTGQNGQPDRQSFRRMQVVGQGLTAMSAPGSTMDTIGGLALVVGNLGPEAEKVLGPGMRRTAYRYRGTEKRADAALVGDMERVGQDMVSDLSRAKGENLEQITSDLASVMQDSALRRGALRQGTSIEDIAAERVLGHWAGQSRIRRLSDDQVAMRTRADIASTTLLDAVPSMEETQLSVAAGELPPSIGVMVDADGDVVSQAQGYNGDHYLPFDLKNLKRLKGGQYVRTRAAGGPTTEDFYTALMTGARQFDVVSNSGVFTVEFDPDVRGGRRYSDRAMRMIQRYGQMLEAINSDSSELFLTDLPAATKASIRREALEEAGSDQDRFQTIYQDRLKFERFKSEVSPEDYEELEATVDEVVTREARDYQQQNNGARMSRAAMSGRRRELMGQMISEEQGDKVRRLQLDGPGYYRAMRTLQQEFPFFIREVDFASVPDWLAKRNLTKDRRFRQFAPTDSGYTRPGQVTSTAAQVRGGAYQVGGGRAKQTQEGAEEQAPTSQSTGFGAAAGTGAISRPAAGGSTPSASGASRTPQALTAALSKDNRQFSQKVTAGLSRLHQAVMSATDTLNPVEPGMTKAEAIASGGAQALVVLKAREAGASPGSGGPKLAHWLLNEASDDEISMVQDVIDNTMIPLIENERASGTNWPAPGFDANAVKDLSRLLRLRTLHSDAADVMDSPDTVNPRPMKFDDIPDSVDAKTYDNALKSWSADGSGKNPKLAAMVTQMEGWSDEQIANRIGETIEEVTEYRDEHPTKKETDSKAYAELVDRQKAWSFLRGREAAKTLVSMGVVKPGDDDPKDLSKAAGRRRQVVIHKRESPDYVRQFLDLVGRR